MSVQSLAAENCYQAPAPAIADVSAREFDPDAFDQWLGRLAGQGEAGILMSLLLKLERLQGAPLGVRRRLSVTRRLMAGIRDLRDFLPRTRGPGCEQSGALGLEQRLWCLGFRNLKQTLDALDGAQGVEVADRDHYRLRLVRDLLACLARQIKLWALWGWPLPPGTWQQAHDLHAYYTGRLQGADAADPGRHPGREPAIETAYKRLLLIGIMAGPQARSLLARACAEGPGGRLDGWARGCMLQDPKSHVGVIGCYLVEASRDEAPRWIAGALEAVERSWVLRPPADLLAVLEADRMGRPPGSTH